VSDAPAVVTEVTELTGEQPLVRALVAQAFRERLGEVEVACDFHRGWNGGWRCRATVHGRPLDFALLRSHDDELIALPVPMPSGWRRRGVAGSQGRRFTVDERGTVIGRDASPAA
jgi:hypothetical protein